MPGDLIEKYIEAERWDEARRLLKAKLKVEPDHHWLQTRLALTYYEQRNYRQALKESLKALRLAPRCPLVLWEYTGALEMLGKTAEAIKVYKRLLKRGVQSIAYGECGEGKEWAASLINDCRYGLARCYRNIGKLPLAIRYLRSHLQHRRRGVTSIYPAKDVKGELAQVAALHAERNGAIPDKRLVKSA